MQMDLDFSSRPTLSLEHRSFAAACTRDAWTDQVACAMRHGEGIVPCGNFAARRGKSGCLFISLGDPAPVAVYVMRRGLETFKIGVSNKPKRRRSSLQVGSPELVAHLRTHWFYDRQHAEWVEQFAHVQLKPWRVRGEWFRLPVSGAPSADWVLDRLDEMLTLPDDPSERDRLFPVVGRHRLPRRTHRSLETT